MKRSILTSIIFAVNLWLVTSFAFAGEGRIHSVAISVEIDSIGSAAITEKWDIDAISDLTEWYLVMNNLGEMELEDYKVFEKGKLLHFDGEWDIDRSLEEKAGKYGYVTKDDGYELCWGLGSMGHHLFTVKYRLTNFVKGFDDANAFNHMFVARGLSFPPDTVSVTIELEGKELTKDNTRVWSFGHYGEIWVKNGKVEAYSTEPFSSSSAMIVMVAFDKDLLTPTNIQDGSFDDMKEEALNGSEYGDDAEEYGEPDAVDQFFDSASNTTDKLEQWCLSTFGDVIGMLVFGLIMMCGFFGIPVAAIMGIMRYGYYLSYILTLKPLRVFLKRWYYLGLHGIDWCREIAFDGNLVRACYAHEDFSYNPNVHKERLTAAIMLRLVQRQVLSLVKEPDKKGRMVTVLQINDWIDYTDNTAESKVEQGLYNMIKAAAGDDSRLQKSELSLWIARKGNQKRLYDWQLMLSRYQNYNKGDKVEVKKFFGLKRFLKDFTLIDERGMMEVNLWNEYLVYATVYGIADKVRADFKKVCPEYFEMTKDLNLFDDDEYSTTPLSDFSTVLWTGIYMNHYLADQRAATSHTTGSSWGGGGGSSWGGGGGFSGGGFGGGGR